MLALPIPIVVDNFADYYAEQKQIEAKELKREAQAKQAEEEAVAAEVAKEHLLHSVSDSFCTSFEKESANKISGYSINESNVTL